MGTGDRLEQQVPNVSARQRLDRVDLQSIVDGLRGTLDHLTRALLARIYNTPSQAVGEIWTGASVTVNPTGPLDGFLRINTELFVGIDSSGRTLVKKAGDTLTVGIPAGGSWQVYLYDTETLTDLTVRRFITALGPFTEIGAPTNVTKKAGVNVHIRSGIAANIVKEDTIGNVTTPLCFLGIAVNTGGSVTFDISAAVNRLSTVPSVAPTFPANNVSNGSMSSVTDMIKAHGYLMARHVWLNSTNFTQNSSNNMGVYVDPPAGIDHTYRKTFQFITVGSGSGLNKGDFDVSSYPSASACLQAAINAAAVSGGGTIVLKPFVSLVMTTDVNVPDGAYIQITGTRATGYTALDMGNFKFTFGATGGGLSLQNIRVTSTSTVVETNDNTLQLINCDFQISSSAQPMFKMTGSLCDGLYVVGCKFLGSAPVDSSTTVGFIAAAIPVTNCVIAKSTFVMTIKTQRFINFDDVRSNVIITDCLFKFGTNTTPLTTAPAIRWGTTTNAKDGDSCGRRITGCTFIGSPTILGSPAITGIQLDLISYVTVGGEFRNCSNGLVFNAGNTATGFLTVLPGSVFKQGSAFVVSGGATAQMTGLEIEGCTFDYSLLSVGVGYLSDANICENTFTDPFTATPTLSITTNIGVERLNVVSNKLKTPTNMSLSGLFRVVSDASVGYLRHVVIRDNSFSGSGSTLTDNVILGGSIAANQLEAISVVGNHFRDMQNVAYTGTANANSAGGFRVLEIRGFSVKSLILRDNHFIDIASNYSVAGAGALAFGRCVRFAPHIDGVFTGVWLGIHVKDNTFGVDTGVCGPFTFGDSLITISDLLVVNNAVHYQYKTGVTYPYTADIPIFTYVNTEQGAIAFRGNYVRPANNTAAIMSRDVFGVGPPAGTALRIENLAVQDNQINIWPDDFGYNTVAGNGLVSYYSNIKQFVFTGNSCGGLDKIRTRGFAVTGSSTPTVPGAGVLWSNNNFIRNS